MEEIYNVVIIGGGNIGSRHAQSLVTSTIPVNIIIIDTDQDSLDICKNRVEEVNFDREKTSVNYLKKIDSIPSKIDLAIIATGSLARLKLMQSLFTCCECKCLILEKFLFSYLDEYELARTLIKEQENILVYVNCMKRVFEAYSWVLNKLNSVEGNLKMVVTGNNWGLAGNSVHYIDLFGLITKQNILHCEIINSSDSKIIESKRQSYIEVIGKCLITSEGNDSLEIISKEGEESPIQLSFTKKDLHLTAVEFSDRIEVSHQNEKTVFNYPFQSHLTINYFNELINTGKISLPNFNESSIQHQVFLKAMNEFMKKKKYDKEWKIT